MYGLTYRSVPIDGDIRSAIDDRTDEAVSVLCLAIDAAACAAEFSKYAGSSWTTDSTLDQAPLIISVVPG
jgi:hypothetical protein